METEIEQCFRKALSFEERLMFREAASCYAQVIEREPGHPFACARLGFVLYNQRRLDEAVVYLNQAVRLNPFYDEPLVCLGMIARERGLFDEALAHFSKALSLNPGSPWILTNMGASLQHMGRWDEGEMYLKRAFFENPNLKKTQDRFEQALGIPAQSMTEQRDISGGSTKKILIVVSAFNRKKMTELSLLQLSRYKTASSVLRVYNDHSTEYDNSFLLRYADEVFQLPDKMGIDALRWHQFRAFLETEYEYLYFTDNDVIHDPHFILMLDNLYEQGKRQLPVSLFHNVFMLQPRLILYYGRGLFIKTSAPGASMFFDRSMVEKILSVYDKVGESLGDMPWDNKAVACLQLPWISPEQSYLEHFGAGGLNSDNFERERAVNPTPYLREKRESVIRYVTEERQAPPEL